MAQKNARWKRREALSNAFHQQGGSPAQSAHLPDGKGGKKHGKAV